MSNSLVRERFMRRHHIFLFGRWLSK